MPKLFNWIGGLFDRPQAHASPLFEAVVEHYKSVVALRQLDVKTVYGKLSVLRYFAEFRGRPIGSIRPFEIARIIRKVHDDGKWAASRAVLSSARDVFNEALLAGWVDLNPALHVKRLPAPVRRKRLTLEQFFAIQEYGQKHFPPWFAPAVRLALITAQRRSDLIRMRSTDVVGGHLRVEQIKTGAKVAIPLALRLDALGCTVGDVINECMRYTPHDSDLLIRTKARPHRHVGPQSLSSRFWVARQAVCPHTGPGKPPTLHEIRSLSERLYHAQGVDTQTLLGHKHPSMTELYDDDRGLTAGQWKFVALPKMPE